MCWTVQNPLLNNPVLTQYASLSPFALLPFCPPPPIYTNNRAERLHPATGLPHGATLLVAPTKDAAEVWSNRLGSGAGLSVLSYVMPLRERRRLSANQVAAFDVVVTTYDVSDILSCCYKVKL